MIYLVYIIILVVRVVRVDQGTRGAYTELHLVSQTHLSQGWAHTQAPKQPRTYPSPPSQPKLQFPAHGQDSTVGVDGNGRRRRRRRSGSKVEGAGL